MKNETIIELAGLKCKMCSYPKKIMVETREATRQKELIKILSKKKDLMRRDKYLISTFLIVLNLVWVELNKLGFTFLLLRKRLLAVLQHCLYCWENLNFVI